MQSIEKKLKYCKERVELENEERERKWSVKRKKRMGEKTKIITQPPYLLHNVVLSEIKNVTLLYL